MARQKSAELYNDAFSRCYRLLDTKTLAIFHRVLRPGGCMFFTVLEQTSAVCYPNSWRKRVMEVFYPLLPPPIKRRLDRRWLRLWLSRNKLDKLIGLSAFNSWQIEEEPFLRDRYLTIFRLRLTRIVGLIFALQQVIRHSLLKNCVARANA